MHAIPIERNTVDSHQRAWQEPGRNFLKGRWILFAYQSTYPARALQLRYSATWTYVIDDHYLYTYEA